MDRYRVIVLREGTAEDETLFEIAGSASLVGRVVPSALVDALDGDVQERAGVPASGRELADRVFDAATAAGVAAEQQAAGPAGETAEQATKRKRRTKAEIAADKEAVALGFRDAAHRAEVERAQAPHPGGPDPAAVPAEVPSDYVPPAGAVVAGTLPGAIVTEPAAAPVAPPYNPFAS